MFSGAPLAVGVLDKFQAQVRRDLLVPDKIGEEGPDSKAQTSGID